MRILKEAETKSGIWVPDSSKTGQKITSDKIGNPKNGESDITSLENKIEKGLNSNDYSDDDLLNDIKSLIQLYGGKK